MDFDEEVEAVTDLAAVRIDSAQELQTLEGFGASVAWYGNWFPGHPNRAEISRILFADLGIDILRLRNVYRPDIAPPDEAALEVLRSAEASLGHPLRTLLTSWSPPGELKKSGVARCTGSSDTGCTLRRNADGTFPYDEFAGFWLDSIQAYRASGIEPYYVSIQNEPDFVPNGWEGCRFDPSENEAFPGYDRALDAVSSRFRAANIGARLIGSDSAHLANGGVISYVSSTLPGQLYGIAHHLYDGNTWKNPDGFYAAMSELAQDLPNLPKFQSEFSPTDTQGKAEQGGFEVAWLIHNSIAIEQASAYLHWELFWNGAGLVSLENPDAPNSWTTTKGYTIREPYYAMRHFSRYTDPGDRVVLSTTTGSRDVRVTSYLNPTRSRLTVVVLNIATDPRRYTLDLAGFEFSASLNFLTTQAAPWQTLTPPAPGDSAEISLPPKAMQTLVFATDPALLL